MGYNCYKIVSLFNSGPLTGGGRRYEKPWPLRISRRQGPHIPQTITLLALLSIENELARTVNYKDVIRHFASIKTRQIPFD